MGAVSLAKQLVRKSYLIDYSSKSCLIIRHLCKKSFKEDF